MRYVELRRHTDNQGDRLTPQRAADAEMIGRDGLHPPCAAFVSAGAARATPMPEIVRHAAGKDDTPITAAAGLRSSVEDRWPDAAKAAAKRADLEAAGHRPGPGRARVLAARLRAAAGGGGLPEGGRALVVCHSPATEAAVLGLAGRVVPPPGKGTGGLLVEDGGDYRVEPLD